jgi:alkaline phosphatase D
MKRWTCYVMIFMASILFVSRGHGTEFVVAFGSCHKLTLPNLFWEVIPKNNIDVWVWGGDTVYPQSGDIDQLQEQLIQLKNLESYKKFSSQSFKILGTWDDHDYGLNDGDGSFIHKKKAQEYFLDFLDVPKNDPLRSQEGIYHSYDLIKNEKKIKIILLDTRTFRDNKNPDSLLLGDKQWEWFEQELSDESAAAILIVSGNQVLPDRHRFEKWANFPKAKEKLLGLISKTKAKAILFLSGDRHFAEISRVTLKDSTRDVYDFTASGLTHTYVALVDEENPYRVGKIVNQRHFGLVRINVEDKPNDKGAPSKTKMKMNMKTKRKIEMILEIKGEDNKTIQQVNVAI